jgi:hypothetical protein
MNLKSTSIKVLAVICAVALILGLIFVAAGYISWKLFWVIVIGTAVMAYIVIPWLRKKSS